MPRPSWSLFDRLVRRLPPADADRVSDAELLSRFAKDRDQAAFELLVWRHGGLVLGVCRRVLNDDHLAEDAFQATFLVLARKSHSLVARNVPGWLYRVARRTAHKAAKRKLKIRSRETVLVAEPCGVGPSNNSDLCLLLDAEIGRLPERFRLPVVLCYLQDHTTAQAARLLRVPQGTVLSRLATARQRLSARLTQRGVTLPAVLVTAAVSDSLVSATVAPAAAFAAGAVAASTPTLLASEVIRMNAWKLPAAAAAGLVLLAGVGTGVAALAGGAPQPDGRPVAQSKPADPPADTDKQRELRRADALRRLADYEQDVLGRIRDLDRKRQDATRAKGDDVDVKVLLESLENTDRGILKAETNGAGAEKSLREAERILKTYDFNKVDEKRLENDVQALMVQHGMTGKVYDKKRALTDLQKTYGNDHPIVKAAAGEVEAAEKEDAARRDEFRRQARLKIADADRLALTARLTQEKANYQGYVEDLDTSKKKRVELVERIARARTLDDANQLIEDELRVYRELRQQLLRQRLILQIGVEGLTVPAAGSDPKVEQLTREVADLKSEVRRLAEAKGKDVR